MDKLSLAVATVTAAKTAQGIVEIPEIQDLWINRYQATTGKNDGQLKFENEKLLFLRVFQNNPKLDNCDPFSKYTAFMDLCTSDLTLADGISYIFSMDNKTVMFMPSWKGRVEQINRMENVVFAYEPEVVFDCDTFELLMDGPHKKIVHVREGLSKRTSESKPIHVYMYVEFKNGKTIPYEMNAIDVLHIRDTRSRSYIQYVNALANDLNKGKVMGDRVTIQYKDKNQQWQKMETDPPMGVTDIVQYFKKTLVRRVYGTLPKLASQKLLDQSIEDKIKASKQNLNTEEAPISQQMPENPPEELADDKLAEEEEFTTYEEIGGENVDLSTGEVKPDETTSSEDDDTY